MTVLILSPDFASHYGPLAVIGRALRDVGFRVVVATGSALRPRVVDDGFEWRSLQLGPSSNAGVAAADPAIERFIAATREGPMATLRLQADDRDRDLLWEPVAVTRRIADLLHELRPDRVVVDHVSFGSTLAMYALDQPFVTVVPGHPTQLPVGDERYGLPPLWPDVLRPDDGELRSLAERIDQVSTRFTERWNRALERIDPHRAPVDDAFRVHGERVLYNTTESISAPERRLPLQHRFVGPLVPPPAQLEPDWEAWATSAEPLVVVALGTFLSHRSDVLRRVASALGRIEVRAAIATGATTPAEIGAGHTGWVVAPWLPQNDLLHRADLVIHHGGNNSVQESLAAGVRQIVLPFSTDQFATAADLEREKLAAVVDPNRTTAAELAAVIEESLWSQRRPPVARPDADRLVGAVIG